MTEARAEPSSQGLSRDGEDQRPRSAIQPEEATGRSAGRQAGTSDLEEPDAQGGRLCVENGEPILQIQCGIM